MPRQDDYDDEFSGIQGSFKKTEGGWTSKKDRLIKHYAEMADQVMAFVNGTALMDGKDNGYKFPAVAGKAHLIFRSHPIEGMPKVMVVGTIVPGIELDDVDPDGEEYGGLELWDCDIIILPRQKDMANGRHRGRTINDLVMSGWLTNAFKSEDENPEDGEYD